MKERIAIVNGIRTPFCKAFGVFQSLQADDLGAFVTKELMERLNFPENQLDELICGNVAQPVHAANVARVIALKAGLPSLLPAYTVQRNCASGCEAVTTAANKIWAEEAEIILSVATESMSNIPFIFSSKFQNWMTDLSRQKKMWGRIKSLLKFRLNYLKPIIGLEVGLTDPVCGMLMGSTAEVLSKEFHITREEQDLFALQSHQRATEAIRNRRFHEEVLPIVTPPKYEQVQNVDNGPRPQQTIEALSKLKPYFERVTGSVTVGNSSQVTDGAAALLTMRESRAKEMGLKPLGYLKSYAYAALGGDRMGLGPVYAINKLLNKSRSALSDFDLIEINEAFAAQVLACLKASNSDQFAKKFLNRDRALGEIHEDRLNVNGGAIALGHPVGATGIRLILTMLKELRLQNKQTGLVSLCVGGGQGAALMLEVE